jgi:hypothetical protein
MTSSRRLAIFALAGLWVFHEGDAIRKSAQAYVARLRSNPDASFIDPDGPR